MEKLVNKDKKWWLKADNDSFWYLVGLIAADGCLSSDGRHVDITAKDRLFLEKICSVFALRTCIGKKYNGKKQVSHHIQISSKAFYRLLLSLNLTPRKSKTIGALQIPSEFFPSFLRGVIDGDGSIRNWVHPQNGHEQWILKVSSGSEKFLKWLKNRVEILYGLYGAIHPKYSGGAFVLKYGKLAAQQLLKRCYHENRLTLHRKYLMAKKCIESKRGWRKSKTVH